MGESRSDRIADSERQVVVTFSIYSPYTNEYIAQVEKIVSLLDKCILPKLNDIEEQSEKASEDTWEQAMSQPGTGEEDPSNFVDEAIEAGVSTFQLLSGLRQGMINFFAAAIFQCFKQQLEEFHNTNPRRFSLLRVSYKNDVKAWNDINDELRLVANTAKHGDGPSSQALQKIRPDLFRPPDGEPVSFDPMFGNQLYVPIQDLKRYRDLIVSFWREYTDILNRKEAEFGSGKGSPDV